MAGMMTESFLSMLLAPVLMLFHVNFVISTIFGRGVRWVTQRRDGLTTWREAISTHWRHTAVGVAWTALLAVFAPSLLPWMAPVLLGLLLSIPFSQLTSRESLGLAARRRGLLATPEELHPPSELHEVAVLSALGAQANGPVGGFALAIVNPLANAVHASLQRERPNQAPATREYLEGLAEKLLVGGPDALVTAEKMALLSDHISVRQLHRAVWTRPAGQLARYWNELTGPAINPTNDPEEGFEDVEQLAALAGLQMSPPLPGAG
jgi:membrane glycosyltransferase